MHSKPIPKDVEEQQLYFTVMSLKDALKHFGVDRVMETLDEDSWWILRNYYSKGFNS